MDAGTPPSSQGHPPHRRANRALWTVAFVLCVLFWIAVLLLLLR